MKAVFSRRTLLAAMVFLVLAALLAWFLASKDHVPEDFPAKPDSPPRSQRAAAVNSRPWVFLGDDDASREKRRKVPARSGAPLFSVMDGNGTPLPGTKVERIPGCKRNNSLSKERLGSTNGKGEFSLLPGRVRKGDGLLFLKEGFQPRILEILFPNTPRKVKVVLKPGFEAVFQCVTPDNFPIEGVEVAVSLTYFPLGYLFRKSGLQGPCSEKNIIFKQVTDKAGKARFKCLGEGLLAFDVMKDGYGLVDIRPRMMKVPGGPFHLTLAPLYIALGKIEGPQYYCCFWKPGKYTSSRLLFGAPRAWVRSRFKGCISAFLTQDYSLTKGWSPIPKTISFKLLFDKIGWKKVELKVRPFRRSIKPERILVKVPTGVDRLGYVVLRPKAGGEPFKRIPPQLFVLQPIHLTYPEDDPKSGSPFGFDVIPKPGEKTGLPDGVYRVSSFVAGVRGLLPKGFKVVSRRGETLVYDIHLKYQFAPVLFHFTLPDGSLIADGGLELKIPGARRIADPSFSSSTPLWLPCAKMEGVLHSYFSPIRNMKFKVKVEDRDDGKPQVVTIPVRKKS
ncbi:MAG: hypothetical protein DRH04_11710 [Deltaproteobacteria bacterium]|nr:MAG: hypothetical protein DRH04_11710 [Deltaproteobacteria bacterium]